MGGLVYLEPVVHGGNRECSCMLGVPGAEGRVLRLIIYSTDKGQGLSLGDQRKRIRGALQGEPRRATCRDSDRACIRAGIKIHGSVITVRYCKRIIGTFVAAADIAFGKWRCETVATVAVVGGSILARAV